MQITLEQFEQNLFASRLMSPDELAAFRQQAADPDRLADAESLTRELVQAKRLTKYQAARIYQGKPKHLRLGEYDVLEFVASGGMGRVYKARKRALGKIVAVKVLHTELVENESAVKRFCREAKVAGRLEHQNVVMALDADADEGAFFLVMEFVDGRNLADLLKIRGPMTIEQAIDCIEQTCAGLGYAHRSGIIHRDIKPANLMLDRNGCVKILDLGLARLTDAHDDSTELTLQRERKVAGTFDYMSPEQATDASTADARSDIYSLGCTLYTLLSGKVPFSGKTPLEKINSHKQSPIPSLAAERDDVPRALEKLYQRMMAKLPSQRPASTEEVIDLLGKIDPAEEDSAAAAPGDDSALSMFFTDEQAAALRINEAEPWRNKQADGNIPPVSSWREPAPKTDGAEPEYQWPEIDMPLGTIMRFGVCGVVAVGAIALLLAVVFS